MSKVIIFQLLAGALFSGGVFAAPPSEGDVDAHQCGSGPAFINSVSKDAMAGSYSATVLVVAGEADLYHNLSGRCSGAWQLIGADYTEMGSCEYVDPDGDRFFGVYTRKGGEGHWKVVAGTGKYIRLEQTGTFWPMGQYAFVNGEVRSCARFKGHFKLNN